MDFHKIKFKKAKPDNADDPFLPKELRNLDYPWFEAKISRLIFKDCSVQIMFEPDYFSDYGADETEPLERTVPLTAQVEVTGKLNQFHEGAYNHFIENALSYEKRLFEYLFVRTQQNIAAAIAAADTRELRAFIKKHKLETPVGLKKQIEWFGLTLYDHGWDSVGFITMDFRCGWDEEHGVSILMHRDKIIADSGLADFSSRGDSVIEHAKCIQSFTTGYDIVLP
jgi:hypothetical protein